MILTWMLFLFSFIYDQIPFKSKDEFEVKLQYTFKQRPAAENISFRFEAPETTQRNQNGSGMLPYLELNVKIIKTSTTELRLKVISNKDDNIISKKIQDGFRFDIDMGFTDDVKDHVTAHEYIVYLLNDKRQEQSKIVIFVKEDGTFIINDEVRGKL